MFLSFSIFKTLWSSKTQYWGFFLSCVVTFKQTFLLQPQESALRDVRRCLSAVCQRTPQSSSLWRSSDSVVISQPYAKARKTSAISDLLKSSLWTRLSSCQVSCCKYFFFTPGTAGALSLETSGYYWVFYFNWKLKITLYIHTVKIKIVNILYISEVIFGSSLQQQDATIAHMAVCMLL